MQHNMQYEKYKILLTSSFEAWNFIFSILQLQKFANINMQYVKHYEK